MIGYGGIEESMVVNPCILTKAVLPLMAETARTSGADVRIIVMTSIGMNVLKDHVVCFRTVEDLNETYFGTTYLGGRPKDNMMRYEQSKVANILYAKQLHKTLDAADVPITVMAVHLGYVWTEAFARAAFHKIPVAGPFYTILFKFTFIAMPEGARTLVYAATSPRIAEQRERYKGAYVVPYGKIAVPLHPQAESAALAKELWDTTEDIIKK